MWTTNGLLNESDVEQKFLYPFLIEPEPLGLGLPPSAIQSKTNIRRLAIGKGQEQKSYYPDYLVVTMGLPLLVLEAKSPKESVEEGYREARLYAAELNALFAHGVAPAKFVICSNGEQMLYGYADQAAPLGIAECATLGAYSPAVATLVSLVSWRKLATWADELAQRIRPAELHKPRRLMGGLGLQNEEVGINSFGASLTSIVAPIF